MNLLIGGLGRLIGGSPPDPEPGSFLRTLGFLLLAAAVVAGVVIIALVSATGG